MKNLITEFPLRNTILILFMAIFIVGCGDSDPENDGNHIPDVNIIQNDKTIKVGELIKLDGVAIDVDRDDLVYQWSFVSTPTDSTAELTTSSTTKTSFVADKAGEYKIKFVATDTVGAKASKIITITAGVVTTACTSYDEIAEDITEDTVFDGCYKITRGILDISNDALLTIKPGSTLVFEKEGGINIGSDGALKAVGTAKEPILFTGEQKTAGYWRSISFRGSNDTRNEIAYATVEYAGAGYGYGSLYLVGNYGTDNRIKLSNTTFQYSASHGFCLEKRSKIDKFENITSTKNAISAGRVNMSLLDKLDEASDFTGNIGDDYITVEYGDVNDNATWKELSVPIYFKRGITIYNDATLTINPGSKLVFNTGIAHLHTGDGALNAVGTAKKPILFTGKQKTAGYWEGLVVESDNTDNKIAYVTVEYAKTALKIYTNNASKITRVTVTSSTFRHNSEYGIYIDYDNDAIYNKDIGSSNTFEDNAEGDIERRRYN